MGKEFRKCTYRPVSHASPARRKKKEKRKRSLSPVQVERKKKKKISDRKEEKNFKAFELLGKTSKLLKTLEKNFKTFENVGLSRRHVHLRDAEAR
jgi:hypothetical protein